MDDLFGTIEEEGENAKAVLGMIAARESERNFISDGLG